MKNAIWRRRLAGVAAALSLIAIWQIASYFVPPFLLPGVPKTAVRFVRLVQDEAFYAGVQLSLIRLGAGWGIGVLSGASLGLLAGLSRPFASYLRSLIAILQSIPPITWAPFLIILFGFGNIPIITVVAIATFFPMALSVMNATEGVSRTHVELARVMGASKWQILTKVYAPEAMPAFVTGAQVAFGNGWRSLIAGEMVVGASKGLGWSINYAGEVADMAGVLVGIAVIGAIASLIDHVLLEQAKRRLLHWRNTGGGEVA